MWNSLFWVRKTFIHIFSISYKIVEIYKDVWKIYQKSITILFWFEINAFINLQSRTLIAALRWYYSTFRKLHGDILFRLFQLKFNMEHMKWNMASYQATFLNYIFQRNFKINNHFKNVCQTFYRIIIHYWSIFYFYFINYKHKEERFASIMRTYKKNVWRINVRGTPVCSININSALKFISSKNEMLLSKCRKVLVKQIEAKKKTASHRLDLAFRTQSYILRVHTTLFLIIWYWSSSQFYNIVDMNYIFTVLLNFLIPNEKENSIYGSMSLKEHILIITLALRVRFCVYISVTF